MASNPVMAWQPSMGLSIVSDAQELESKYRINWIYNYGIDSIRALCSIIKTGLMILLSLLCLMTDNIYEAMTNK